MVDQNNNGIGEYGLFQELAGAEIPRGGINARTPGEFISQELGAVDANGIASKAGYHFLIYLPTAPGGTAMSEGDFGVPLPNATVAVDAPPQEVRWACYAWPISRTETGSRAFVVNQTGTVYQTSNEAATQLYSGTITMPLPEAAFIAVPGNDAIENLGGRFPRLGVAEVGADGGTWVPVN